MINENSDFDSKRYQSMLNEVEKIITEISTDECDLDALVEKVENGYALIKALRQRLDDTRERIEKLRLEYESPDKN